MKQFVIKSKKDITEFFRYIIKELEVSFHPDDSFSDIVNINTGEPTFTPEEAGNLEDTLSACHNYCNKYKIDIYEIGLAILQEEGMFPANVVFDFKSLPDNIKPIAVTNYLTDELIAGGYHSLDLVFKHALDKAEPDLPSKYKPGLYALEENNSKVHFLMSAADLKFNGAGEIVDSD